MIKLTSADKVIVMMSILIIGMLYFVTWSGSESSRHVTLSVSGEKRHIIDLFEEKVLSVDGIRGVSKLEIRDGKIRFLESACNTHFCIRSGWLNKTIGLIACLPNGVSLNFSNNKKTYDAINF